jgi:hypothetical protein
MQLDQLAGAALVKARPWDVIGAALGAPMIVWGLLGWFSTVGDSGGGVPGFFSGTGAAGIALVLAASTTSLNQILAGRPHDSSAPPVSVFLAAAGVIVVLGGMLAKPQNITISAGAVAGLLTALSQVGSLTVGWVKGSGKAVKASRVAALRAQQEAADRAAAGSRAVAIPPYAPPYGPPYAQAMSGVPQSGFGGPPGSYPATQYAPSSYPQQQYPPSPHPPSPHPHPHQQYPSGPYAPNSYPQQQYPQQQYPQQQFPQQQYPQQQYPQQQYPQPQYPPSQ